MGLTSLPIITSGFNPSVAQLLASPNSNSPSNTQPDNSPVIAGPATNPGPLPFENLFTPSFQNLQAAVAAPSITVDPNLLAQNAKIYLSAVDPTGKSDQVDQNAITQNQTISIPNARVNVITNYMAEFEIGSRTANPVQYANTVQKLVADLQGLNGPNAKSAATLEAVAASYRNSGSAYNNPSLARLLQTTGNSDLIKGGTGVSDIETVGAVAQAIRRGTLTLSQVYNTQTGLDANNSNSVIDKAPYDKAITYVTQGGFLSDLQASETGGQASQGVRGIPDMTATGSTTATTNPFNTLPPTPTNAVAALPPPPAPVASPPAVPAQSPMPQMLMQIMQVFMQMMTTIFSLITGKGS